MWSLVNGYFGVKPTTFLTQTGEASTHNPSSQFISGLVYLPQFKPISLCPTGEHLFQLLVHQTCRASS